MAGVGTPRRLSYGALAAGIGGIVLIVSLFLDWFSSGGFGLSGWEALSFTDVVLLVLGLLAIGYALIELLSTPVHLPFQRERALTIVGIIATTLTLDILIEESNQAFGLWLAALASIAILVGGLLAENRPALAVTLGGGPTAATQQMTPAGGYGAPPPAGGYAQPPVQPPPPAAAGPPPVQEQPPPPAAGAQAESVGPVQPPPQPAVPPPPPPPPGGTADWYPDPHGQKRLRYYDGQQWTEHTAD